MPRFHFHITNGHKIVDPSGRRLKDEKEACAEAEHIAAQWETGRKVQITDGDGREVGKVPTKKARPNSLISVVVMKSDRQHPTEGK
jgi:hypothetical protein